MSQKKKIQNIYVDYKWLQFLLICLLTLGIFFRFANLGQKPYWGDESLTSQRISGYTNKEFSQILLRGDPVRVEELMKYQRPSPERSLDDAMNAFVSKSEHPPLYYLMARFWMQLFGDYLNNPRSLSVAISLLVFPGVYWLCLELFESQLVGWVAIALIAISPFHLLYAQEARQYSLWTFIISLSSLVLLRAMRLKTKLNWGIYTVTLALGLYTHILHVMIVIAHGIYIIFHESFRLSKIVIAYLIASFTGFLLFLPWLIVIVSNLKEYSKSPISTPKTPLVSLLQNWILNVSRIFLDFNESFSYENLWLYMLIIILVSYSLFFLTFQTKKQVWLFIWTLIGIPLLFLLIPDLVLAGRRFASNRYFIPGCLGIQIAVAYLLTTKITYFYARVWHQKLWQIITLALLLSGLLSCVVYSQKDTWWNKHREYYHSEVAKVVNQAERPLMIAPWFDIRTLSHSLASHVVVQDIRLQKDINSVGIGFSEIFIYKDKGSLMYFLENHPQYQIEKTYSWKKQTTPLDTSSTTIWQILNSESKV